ncbi:MAG: T9SS type A sorting domain-containing protein [Crocinitomicaceae bacterium]
MKKLLLSAAILVGMGGLNAQTPVGTVVNNFTLTDINGNSHSLFDYLDAGKMVVIDVSATWCGPCWSYHNTGALNNFYNQYGPSGTNQAMVFFVEGDPSTTSADLNGTGADTQGDWVSGENMAIIDLANTASFENTGMSIDYFPEMYVICPNRIIVASGVAGAIGSVTNLASYLGQCPPPASQPVDVSALSYKGDLVHCEGSYTPKVQIQNMGTSALTAATITVTQGGNTVSTGTYSGSLATYGVATVNCTPIANFTGGALAVTVTTTGDASATNNNLNINVAGASVAASQYVTVKITTDAYGSETTWKLTSSTGAVVAQGGPWANLSAAGQTVQTPVQVTLNPSQCYTFEILDSYGDGICCSYGNGAYSVVDANNTVLLSGGEFADSEKGVFKTGVASLDELNTIALNVFPNPATDAVNVVFEATASDYAVSLSDLQGRTVASQTIENANGTQTIVFATDNVAKGSYIVTVRSNGATTTKNVVVK